MDSDRKKWNRKYLEKPVPRGPSKIVETFVSLAPNGKALDIAAGNGRNACFLADRGFGVEAVDISDVGLAQFARPDSNIYPVCADLDRFDIPPERYSLILNIRFLNRRLFPQIKEGLAVGGLLIFETFLYRPEDGAARRDFLLRRNELLHGFLSLSVLYYQESVQSHQGEDWPVASLVARKKS